MFACALNGNSTEGDDAICQKERKLGARDDMPEICEYQTLAYSVREAETRRHLGTEMLQVQSGEKIVYLVNHIEKVRRVLNIHYGGFYAGPKECDDMKGLIDQSITK